MNLVCFSHLRWNFVYQRPQHLLTRFSKDYVVYYVEEPVFDEREDGYSINEADTNIFVVIPHLQNSYGSSDHIFRQKSIINKVFSQHQIHKYIFWYYSPIALLFTNHLNPLLIIYDCMDELSAFKFASPLLPQAEQELFSKADIVLTGGYSLYQHKKSLHNNIHCFASSIDKKHFSKARILSNDPDDQSLIPHPRFGFFGVIDERFDINLLRAVADEKPDWHFILIGPVIKIDHETLPKNSNIHYLGSKSYNDLPSYISRWDIAIIPFAINQSTRFISPTKTPEYLAAGKPVISTAIQDVISPYGNKNLVHIVLNSTEFINAAETELKVQNRKGWLQKVDHFLADNSWNKTWQQMNDLINQSLLSKTISNPKTKINV